jgi:predicted DNA-binding transcriptional regulator YafY
MTPMAATHADDIVALLPLPVNRTDRLLAIVLELQSQGWQRAEDLAARFEVTRRTVYRDMQALSQAGVPIVSVPGQGYSLAEGYFLPPLAFTPDEAVMLLLGGDFVAQNFDAQYRAAAQAAGRKIEAVLPEKRRAAVRDLQRGIRFIAGGSEAAADERWLPTLRRAILERRSVRFQYHARSAPESAAGWPRQADPYGLAHVSGAWYLVAHDHLRRDLRHFRLDRLESLALLDKAFQRPADFKLDLVEPAGKRPIVVRALFSPAAARWVQEDRSFFAVREEPRPDGLLVTFRVRQERDLLQWLLGWGAQVQVLEPASLREQMAREAEALLRNHRPL